MAENEAEPKAGGGLFKKLLIFGGGGILLLAIGLGAGYFIFMVRVDPLKRSKSSSECRSVRRRSRSRHETGREAVGAAWEEVFETIYREFTGTFTARQPGREELESGSACRRNMTTLS